MGNGIKTQEGRARVAAGTGGIMKEWGRDLKKETNEAAEQKFPGQQAGLQNNFLREVRDASLLET